jgi:outer membrane protein assembly factor BamD (BamD/ComL family)
MRIFLFLFFISSLFCKEVQTAQDFFDKAVTAFHNQQWGQVINAGKHIVKEHRQSLFAKEAYFYLGAAYFHENDFDMANRYFSKYLENAPSPKFFEQTMRFKFRIAEAFRKGAKKHLFTWEKAPSWIPGREEAFAIYDEVIHSFPHDELAAKALFGKAKLQGYYKDFKDAIDTLQTLIRQFPSNDIIAEAYLELQYLYLDVCKRENLDPNLLDMAYLNLERFKKAFPGEERLQDATKIFQEIKEVFAHNFYETGRFYERTNKRQAAIIYYKKILVQFPQTHAAAQAKIRLDALEK